VDATVIALVRTALNVVMSRILTMLGLLMTFALACWAMYAPVIERLYVAGGFAILVYIPSVVRETRLGSKEKSRERQIEQE
jgi:hypothetical protein